MRRLPWLLVGLRVALGPVIVVAAVRRSSPAWIVAALTAGLLSDIFDGVIARRTGTVTEALRVGDSRADTWYLGCVAVAAWLRAAPAIRAVLPAIVALFALQCGSWLLDLVLYRRIASFHAWSAKLWGITLFMAAVSLAAFGTGGWPLWAAIAGGVLANADGIAIKLQLREWTHDVPSCFHAAVMRRKAAAGRVRA